MQTPNEKKQMFLDMQEHPEKYSEEQLEFMMDELDRLPDVDKAWHEFEQNHHQIAMRSPRRWLKMAASIIGVIMASGITFAAIHIVRQYQNQEPKTVLTGDVTKSVTTVSPDTLKDIVTIQPVIYDNITLDNIARDIAAYHNFEMVLENEQAKQLRFYFVWKQDDSIQEVVEKLNMFEQVDIAVDNGKLIVR